MLAVLLLATLPTIPKFYDVNSLAGLLLLPYLGWTCFASTLINCSILSGNPVVSPSGIRVCHNGVWSRVQLFFAVTTCTCIWTRHLLCS